MSDENKTPAGAADFKRFLRTDLSAAAFFAEHAAGPAILTRAPGRLDVMGGVADYSGSLVAEMTIAEAALVALAPRSDRTLRVWSRGIEAEGFAPQVSISLNDFYSPDGSGTLLSYDAVRSLLCCDPQTRWAAYLLGCVYVLLAEGIVPDFPQGANLLLDSRVPLGAGVSSSAAIEVAAMSALNAAFHLNLDGVTVARLSQRVENKVVGAPCGIMDQMTSALGVPNSLLLILCQPHEVQGTQALPDGVKIYGINSGVKHSVGGSAYTRARVAAFMGRKLLGEATGRDLPYVVQCSTRMYESVERAGVLPKTVLGSDFLALHGETGDPVTHVDPATEYPVKASTEHAIYENLGVTMFVRTLAATKTDEAQLVRAGRFMYLSHDSYTRIGLGCPETDLLVQLGRAAGPGKGIYGAKITGGGSGGTVAFLTDGERAAQTVHEIAEAYGAQTGRTPQVFEGGLSPGAMAFGSEQL
jgi:L-arabinokinase